MTVYVKMKNGSVAKLIDAEDITEITRLTNKGWHVAKDKKTGKPILITSTQLQANDKSRTAKLMSNAEVAEITEAVTALKNEDIATAVKAAKRSVNNAEKTVASTLKPAATPVTDQAQRYKK